MKNLNQIAKEVIKCVVTDYLQSEDNVKMQTLITSLFDERKQLYWGVQSGSITTDEAASVILGHLYTENNGYYKTRGIVNFDATHELSKLLGEII